MQLTDENKGAPLLARLAGLATHKSSDDRRLLLGELSELYFSAEKIPAKRESFLFAEIVNKIVNEVEVDVRASFSKDVCAQERLPVEIAKNLACQESAIAAPVLENSQVFSDDDLVEIAKTQSQDHLLAIARRETLSEAVTDTLIDRGEMPVLQTVSGNTGAQISEDGFDKLVAKAAVDEELQINLLQRVDMSSSAIVRLKSMVSEELRARLELSNFDVGKLKNVVEKAAQSIAEETQTARKDRLGVRVMIADVKEGKKNLDEAVCELTAAENPYDLGWLLAEMVNIPVEEAVQQIVRPDSVPISIIAKSADLGIDAFNRIMQLRAKQMGLSGSHIGGVLKTFEEMSPLEAQRSLRYVVAQGKLAADGSS